MLTNPEPEAMTPTPEYAAALLALLTRHAADCALCNSDELRSDPAAYIGATCCEVGDTLEGAFLEAAERLPRN
jgi:hypothetical protein